MSISAYPVAASDLLPRQTADEACQVCTDCTPFDDKDTCVEVLPKIGGRVDFYNYGDDSHIAVQFGHDTYSGGKYEGGKSYAEMMTIASNELDGEGYNIQITFNKTEHDDMDKVISTTKVPFYYTIKGPKGCTSEVPYGFSMGYIDSVRAQRL